MRYLLGVDIGTHASKGVLVDESGRIAAAATLRHATSRPHVDWAEHDADSVWWGDTVALARELPRQAGIPTHLVAGLACSAIGPCVVVVDGNGRPLRPGILYGIDRRANDQIVRLEAELTDDWIRHETGAALSAQAGGPKVLWIREQEPDVWRATRRVMTATSYIVYRLTGRVVMDHYTAAAYGPMYSIRRRDWSARGIGPICTRSMLPDLGWSTDVAGTISRSAAAETGLTEGTAVTFGTADAAAEAVAAGVLDPGDTLVMYGSSMFFIRISDRLPSSRALWPTVYLSPDAYALTGGTSSAGALLAWFCDMIGPAESGGDGRAIDDALAALEAEAADAPRGADGLLALPYFSGERTPLNDPRARGMIAGLTLSHQRAHVFRALLEGIAFSVRENFDAMTASGLAPRRVVAIGGGTKNRVLAQIVSDVTGMPQEVHDSIGAAYGDAMMAAVGVGILKDLTATRTWGRDGALVQPDRDAFPFYDDRYELYRQLYRTTVPLMHALAQPER